MTASKRISKEFRRFFFFPALIFSLIISAQVAVPQMARADNPPRKILTGWLAYYGMKTGLPSAVTNSDLISDISPFWYTLKDENTITDLYTPANPSVPISVPIATLQSMNFTIIPTLTDGTNKGVLAGLISNQTSRANLVKTITSLVTTNQYNGIDLDFENFAFVDGNTTWPTTQPLWVQFISELSTALHNQGKLLSVTTPVLFDPTTGKKGYYVYAWSQIAPAIDRLRIMTYDYSTTTPGPIGPINWTESAVKYAISVIPASKVFVGVAGYGRDWVTNVVGICPADVAATVSTMAKAATFVMRDAAKLASDYGATPTYDKSMAESTFTYQKIYNGLTASGLPTTCTATRVAWYQDPQAFIARANLVSKYRIGGIAQWTIGMEDALAASGIRDFAKTIAPDQVLGTLSTDLLSTPLGGAVSISGVFKLPDSRPIVSLPVIVEVKNGTTDWHQVFSGPTSADGTLATKLLLGQSTSIRMRSDGTWDRLASSTGEKVIAVRRLISWSAPTSIKHGVNYVIAGQVQPKVAGVTVILDDGSQASAGISIKTPTALTDADGKFSITLSVPNVGIKRYRVVTTPDSKLDAANSEFINILVR